MPLTPMGHWLADPDKSGQAVHFGNPDSYRELPH